MKKTYRRFIRIGNELVPSPRFDKKADAEKWYLEMRRKKQHLRDGLIIDDSKDGVIFIDFARVWIKRRMKNYPMSTWKADEQRLRVYVLPLLSELPMSQITGPLIRNLLLKISEEGFLKEDFSISSATRNRVKALLSAMFSDALNESPPLVMFNPVLGIKIKEKRTGKSKPRFLADVDECIKFISAAQMIGWTEYVVACIFLMSGVRKQELIALRWSSFNSKNRTLEISEKYEQASNSIKEGTKGGENVSRVIPIPSDLALVLKEHKERSLHISQKDFILCRAGGEFYGARDISTMIEKIRDKSGLDISPHGLRHTFGREFIEKTGNSKALQAILGHTSSTTTDLYSELSGNRIKGFGEAVSYQKRVLKRED